MRWLAWADQAGLINIHAVLMSTTYLTNGLPSLNAFLKEEGLSVPVAYPLTSHVPSGTPPYQPTLKARGIAEGYITGSETYTDAVTLGRTILAASPTRMNFLALGYLNNFQEILNSPADGISGMTGRELIAAKCGTMHIMGGVNPSGSSNNFDRSPQAISAARDVVANWPPGCPIVYHGHEMGTDIITGGNLIGQEATDWVAQALLLHGSATGRNSWDPLAALAYAAPSLTQGGFTFVRGKNAVDSFGANVFTPNVNGKDMYLVKQAMDATFQSRINAGLVKSNWPTYQPYPVTP